MTKTSLRTRRLVVAALFLCLALVMRLAFSTYLPLFGESGMRLSVHTIFSAMPAILFGPVYGGLVSGLSDFLGWVLRPSGAWLPQLTATAVLGGVLRGVLWWLLRNRNENIMRGCVAFCAVGLLAFGLFHTYAFHADGIDAHFYEAVPPLAAEDASLAEAAQTRVQRAAANARNRAAFAVAETTPMHGISRMAVTRAIHAANPPGPLGEFILFSTTAMVAIGALLLLLLALDFFFAFVVKWKSRHVKFMPLVVAMLVPAVVVSTLNTWVLRETIFPAWQLFPFVMVWLPRVVQAIATTVPVLFIMAFLLGIVANQPHLRMLITGDKKER